MALTIQELTNIKYAPMPNYPQYLRGGDLCKVKCPAIMLERIENQSTEYPIHLYNGKTVTVMATRARETYPDDEGYVEVLLPFAYKGSNGKMHSSMIVLYSLLQKDWLMAARVQRR